MSVVADELPDYTTIPDLFGSLVVGLVVYRCCALPSVLRARDLSH